MSNNEHLIVQPLNRSKLWKMAQRITYLQQKASQMTDDDKKKIDWNLMEEEWFDWLEEELTGKKEE